MVSPCKKKKVEKKGKGSANAASPSAAPNNSLKRKKPLSDKKFYLDIRNNAMLKKIEEKLIALGGVNEVFLVKDVDYVVTDRKNTGVSSPAGVSSTPSPCDSPSNAAPQATRTRSRGEAMLERVKQQTLKTTCDIINKATSWNIPIYPLQRFLLWLEKASKKASSGSGGPRVGLRELRGNFLKVEQVGGNCRPELRVLANWPRLDLSSSGPPFANNTTAANNINNNNNLPAQQPGHQTGVAIQSPAANHGHNDHSNNGGGRMTRKQSGKLGGGGKDSSSGYAGGGGGGGYCEVCRVNYNWLDEHITSENHVRCVNDNSQYHELDSLISSAALSAGIRKSLRIAKSPPPVMPPSRSPQSGIGGSVTSSMNGHLPLNSQPTNQHTNHYRHHHHHHRLRSSHHSPRRVSRKRLSAEEKLIEDNKAYYKVEVLNSKLRSTGVLQKTMKDDDSCQESGVLVNGNPPSPPPSPPAQPVVVRFKKVRKSMLSVLSDEAENFMFGPSEKRDEDSQHPADNENSCDEYKCTMGRSSRLRRLSHLQDSNCVASPTSTASVKIKEEIKEEIDSDSEGEVRPQVVTFSFEMDPAKIDGAWHETKQRQETLQEMWLPMYHRYPKVVLPYEMPYQERLRMLQQAKRTRSRRFRLDDKPRKSPRCHASTLAMLSSGRRVTLDCCEDETTASSMATQESSSSATMDVPAPSDIHNHQPSCTRHPPPPVSATTVMRIQQCIVDSFDPSIDRYGAELLKQISADSVLSTFDVDLRTGPCLPIDPAVVDIAHRETVPPIPPSSTPPDVISIVRTFDNCTSIESVAIEAAASSLRPFDSTFFDNSCASSDCSEVFGFSEDGRSVFRRRRKKKKRNMTGWPMEKQKKKLQKKSVANGEGGSDGPPLNGDGLLDFQDLLRRQMSLTAISTPVKRGPGRPRIYPPGMSPSMKKKLSQALARSLSSPTKPFHKSPKGSATVNLKH